jgi:succinate-semialdehyde dehydrogenase / glutarate-semialdehyde dehydrogenase
VSATATTGTLVTTSPIDGEALERYALDDDRAVDAALNNAAAAQRAWRRTPFDERSAVLRAVADQLEAERDEAALLVTLEMGKTLTEARAEIDKSAWACRWFAEHGRAALADEPLPADGEAYVHYAPLGVVLAVMPWNYPVWQVIRALAPALMAGNGMVLPHAANVTGSARRLAALMRRAGVPDGLFEVIVIESRKVAAVIGDPRIAAATLTGSDAAGVAVATACAQHLKPSVLELGGSDPFVVLADADIAAAASAAVRGRFLNTGQACIAAKRLIVEQPVADAFEDAFVAAASALRVDDPRVEGADLGPMARADLRDELAEQLRRGLAEGGRLALDGGPLDRPGAWFAPVVVTGVDRAATLAREETFGPLAAVLRVPDTTTAIAVANDTPYGLSASVWTGDIERGRAVAAQVDSGAVFINTTSVSDPRVPFGGIKRSGWGRELGVPGLRAFVNAQSTTVASSDT